MQNFNPHGNKKINAILDKTYHFNEIEIKCLNSFWNCDNNINNVKMYVSENGNFNYVLNVKQNIVFSIPKLNNNCKASVFGSFKHTIDYINLIN